MQPSKCLEVHLSTCGKKICTSFIWISAIGKNSILLRWSCLVLTWNDFQCFPLGSPHNLWKTNFSVWPAISVLSGSIYFGDSYAWWVTFPHVMQLIASYLCVNTKTVMQQRSLLSFKRIVCQCPDNRINAAMKNFLVTAKWLASRQFFHLFHVAKLRAWRTFRKSEVCEGGAGTATRAGLAVTVGCVPTWSSHLEKSQGNQFSACK